MRRILKLLALGSLLFLALLLVGVTILFLFFPRAEPANRIVIERTPARVERGRYLVQHVANCLNCHSERNWSLYAGPVIPGTEGMGASLRVIRPSISSTNITPFGVGETTDGELVRAISSGINRDGRALHPFMPYDTYSMMAREDLISVVAYLRTLPPIENDIPPPRDKPLLMLVARLLPRPYVPPPIVDKSDTIAYGKYLTTIAECGFCHGANLSDGRSLPIPGSRVRVEAADIRPALAAWSRENFIGVFKSFDNEESRRMRGAGEDNTVMPWLTYSGLTEEDLGAIYDYLDSLVPPP